MKTRILSILAICLAVLTVGGCDFGTHNSSVSEFSQAISIPPIESSVSASAPQSVATSSEVVPEDSSEPQSVAESSAVLSEPSSDPQSLPESSNAVSEPVTVGEMRGVWISFYDLADITDEDEYRSRIDRMFDLIEDSGLNAVFFHVRPFADALYPSAIFPFSHIIGFKDSEGRIQGEDPGYDPLAYAVSAAHARGLQLHAWLNPYRVWTGSDDVTELAPNNIARIWLTDGNPDNDSNVIAYNNKLYFNPASPEVRSLIVSGIAEIISNYAVDGIHFDDYFYPTTNAAFDADSFAAYREAGGLLAQDDWRRENVTKLISDVYQTVHAMSDLPFGVSPAGNMQRVMTEEYADVALWGSGAGYVDYLCPQVYFGFRHETFPFVETCADWRDLVTSSAVKLYIGLPAYKLGAADSGAGSGKKEFQTDSEILASMVECTRDLNTDGFIIYSYEGLAGSANSAEREALRTVLTD